ncbi:MAG: hypothetical protein ACRD6I_13605 [Candidatus Acidiferrales bacterium]
MIPASRQRNYLQSGLYVIIAGILAAVLLERLLTYAEAAEKAAMEATLARLQAGLYARLALHTLKGEYQAIEALPRRNPFIAADMQAGNYRGEFVGVPAEIEGGNWLYERVRNELVYVPNLKRYLAADPSDPAAAHLRFRLEMRRTASAYTGVTVLPVTAFRWDPLP